MSDLRQQLRQCLKGRVCLMGLGNADHGDDAFGVRLAEELIAGGVQEVIVAGTSPDRYLGGVLEEGFEHLVFLDAVDFGGAPGSSVFLDSTEMAARFPQVSTHKISLGVWAMWVEATGTTKAWLLGVQPESLKPAQSLTPTMQTTLGALRDLLCSLAMRREEEPTAEVQEEVNAC
ncbi:MAG TPA: hydrogenase maturation protease [Terriglobales bacterium]|jgi:hydrogenase 3 maturation protease|nr:hydrogenase maturation protease [Terriglobales bacterium]